MGVSIFFKHHLPQLYQYVPAQWHQSSAWKPAIRSAVASWICLVILLIEPAARALGNAPFFILITSFMIPPSLPFLASLEVIFTSLILTHISWAWTVIGCAIASAVRDDPSPERTARYSQRYDGQNLSQAALSQRLIFDGLYLDAKSSVVFGVFLGVSIGALAWLRITNPPKFALPSILGSILSIVVCSYGALIPSFQTTALLGTYFAYPLLSYAAVAIIVSCVVFPESVQHRFLSGISATLDGVEKVAAQQFPMLCTPPLSDDFTNFKKTAELRAAAALKYQSVLLLKPNLTREFSYSRWSGSDCKVLEEHVRRLLLRAGGLQVYYDLIRTWQDRYRRADEKEAAHELRRGADEEENEEHHEMEERQQNQRGDESPDEFSRSTSRDGSEDHASLRPKAVAAHAAQMGHHSIDLLKKSLHNSHHHAHPSHKPKPVGLWETLSRANLEGRLISRRDRQWINDVCPRLGPSSQRLLSACEAAVAASAHSIRRVNKQRIWTSLGLTFDVSGAVDALLNRKRRTESSKQPPPDIFEASAELKAALDSYRTKDRHAAIEPYRAYFDKLAELDHSDAVEFSIESLQPPPHRALFYSLLYEFQLIEFAMATKELSNTVLQLEKKVKIRLHKPRLSKVLDLLRSSPAEGTVDEEAPGEIKGLVSGDIAERDPDARPPENLVQYFVKYFSKLVSSATSGNLSYACRAGALVVLVTLPQYFDSTARFYYYNRGLWVSIMTVFTFQRWAGDTTLQWLFRTVGTFIGVAIGCAIWYIGSGTSAGNPYGLATICAALWPFIFLYRTSAPPPVLVAVIIMTVSIALVIGYSIIDGFGGFSLSNPGYGWEVTWRRFTLVMIGLTCSYIASFLPRPESARQKVRLTLAQSLDSLADVYTELVSFAAQSQHNKPDMRIVRNLITINNKLRVSVGQRMAAAPLELKAGPWPQTTYQTLQKTQLEISDLLGQLMVVYLRSDKDEAFRRGLLLRTRFLDPSFIGEVSSTLWMVAQALRHGSALPHVTIAPLESRLNSTNLGLLVPKGEHTPMRHSSTAITSDAFRDALLQNLSKNKGRKRQRWGESSDDVVYPMFDQRSPSRPAPSEKHLMVSTPGAQTPMQAKASSSQFTLSNRRNLSVPSAFGQGESLPGSVPLSPVGTRTDAERADASANGGITSPPFPAKQKQHLDLDDILSFETLQDENYMIFSAGVSLSFSLIRRIDALVMLTKELVGESYRVHNLGKDAVEGRYTLNV